MIIQLYPQMYVSAVPLHPDFSKNLEFYNCMQLPYGMINQEQAVFIGAIYIGIEFVMERQFILMLKHRFAPQTASMRERTQPEVSVQ